MRKPYTGLRHYIVRLANHVQVVRVLLAAARRLPMLFEEFQIEVVNGPAALRPAPKIRSALTLSGIINRMRSAQEIPDDFEERLRKLDQNMTGDLESLVHKEYGEKSFKPRVHAELVLLHHSYRHRETLQFFEEDRFIGTSKPACYCCFLYFRDHPGHFEQPASHQKIYLNWLPPTSNADIQDCSSLMAIHELSMLNKMVVSIRKKVIEQVKIQTGGHRTQPRFDSVTWDSFTVGSLHAVNDVSGPHISDAQVPGSDKHSAEVVVIPILGPESRTSEETTDPHERHGLPLSRLLHQKLAVAESSDDDDEEDGGVLL